MTRYESAKAIFANYGVDTEDALDTLKNVTVSAHCWQDDDVVFATGTPIYYYIGHFSKYLKRGAKRIAITRYTDALDVCAFRNPNGEVVCVILNSSNLNLPVNIRIKDTVTEIQINAHTIKTFLLTESITGESYET